MIGSQLDSRYPTIMVMAFDVVVDQDAEGYYVASVPALHGCHTQARSLDELMKRVGEVIELCLDEQGQLFNQN
jgi:predicted RNase H-like HicB family nuclease